MKLVLDPKMNVTPGEFGKVVGDKFYVAEELYRIASQATVPIRTVELLYDYTHAAPLLFVNGLNWSIQQVDEALDKLKAILNVHAPKFLEKELKNKNEFGLGAMAPPKATAACAPVTVDTPVMPSKEDVKVKLSCRIIGFIGRKYHGKNTVADMIADRINRLDNPKNVCRMPDISSVPHNLVEQFHFADPVKEYIEKVLLDLGIDSSKYGKSDVIPELGKTKRQLYVSIGTGWGRNMVNSQLWTMMLMNRVKMALYKQFISAYAMRTDQCLTILVPDVRFQEECNALCELGSSFIGVRRLDDDGNLYVNPDDPHSANDESEASLEKISIPQQIDSYTLVNRGTLENLQAQVDSLMPTILAKQFTWQTSYWPD